jgi:hypothetical protein
MVRVVSSRNCTGVAVSNRLNSTGVSASRRVSGETCSTSQTAGTMNSTSFSTNWNACTYVAARMPPSARVTLTAAPAITTPTQYGLPVTTPSTCPAAVNCGTR